MSRKRKQKHWMRRTFDRARRGVSGRLAAEGRWLWRALASVGGVIGSLPSFVDTAIYQFAPGWGAQRMAARKTWEAATLAHARVSAIYEGADRDRFRGDKWMTSRLSPDSALELDLEELRHRSRVIYRDDALGGAIDSRVNNVVGTGFTLQAKVKPWPGVMDDSLAEAWNDRVEQLFGRWAGRCSRDGLRPLWQICRLCERLFAVDGEYFVVLSDVERDDCPVPLALEVVDADRVETPPHQAMNPLVRLGIERDAAGKIVAYWIRKTNPHDTVRVNYEYERVDAWRVVHDFEQWFPAQSRGLPWMTRVLTKVRDVKDLDEAEIIRDQIQACYAAFVKVQGGSHQIARGSGRTTNAAGDRLEEIEPGQVHYLNPGEEITFGTPGGSTTHAAFQDYNFRRIAAGLNWPFELLTKNWTGLSFAGGRLSLNDGRIDVQCRQQFMRDGLLRRVFERFVDELVVSGQVKDLVNTFAYRKKPWYYRTHAWIAQRWSWEVNPGEQIDADIKAVEHNFTTKGRIAAERFGEDRAEVAVEREREKTDERKRGIDPPAQAGAAATQPAQTPPSRSAAKEPASGKEAQREEAVA